MLSLAEKGLNVLDEVSSFTFMLTNEGEGRTLEKTWPKAKEQLCVQH